MTEQKLNQQTFIHKLESLTERERQVLASLTNGETNKELAKKLGISPRTIQKHLQRIYAKLDVDGRTAAALVAVRFVASKLGETEQ